MSAEEPVQPHRPFGGLTIRLPTAIRNRDWLTLLRGLIRGSEALLALVAVGIGGLAGVCAFLISRAAQFAHERLFGIAIDLHLSASAVIPPERALIVPVAGGLVLGLMDLYRRVKIKRVAVDPVEANALRGGRMSLTDSIIVTAQTVISNGCGASVGLEAAYTQIGSGLASKIGSGLRLRRSDLRIMVGAGAAAGIAAGFGAPLTGAFYAFELIVGVYSVGNVAAIMAASLAAFLTVSALGGAPYAIQAGPIGTLHPSHYLILVCLGLFAATLGVAVMQATAVFERAFERTRLPLVLRPAVGGLAVGALALITPQVLAAGHGALQLDFHRELGIPVLLGLIGLKLLASLISLGSGFRGGLFFASLFVGVLLGKLFAAVCYLVIPGFDLDPMACVLVGMGAVAVSIVGGPLTMSFLVLETTGDYSVTAVVLAACVAASLAVRETFGYSFSTWRLHLRGETIRSAADVGWLRSLTVGTMMRRDPPSISSAATLTEFRRRYPLGSTHVVVILDEHDRYAGLLPTPEAFAADRDSTAATLTTGQVARFKAVALLPELNIKEALAQFEEAEGESLAVVDGLESGRVIGLLTEAHATRRYAEELDKASRGVLGET